MDERAYVAVHMLCYCMQRYMCLVGYHALL